MSDAVVPPPAASPRVVVVGESNPYGKDPRYALYHKPPNSAGGRLYRLVMGLRVTSYHRYTRRVNLCAGAWNRRSALAAAAELLCEREDDRAYVLLGRKVADAFGVGIHPEFSIVKVDDADGCLWDCALLPHPSGRCRAWNAPGAYERARALLCQVAPAVPWGEVDRPSPPLVTCCTNCGKPTEDNVCPECGFDEGGGVREEVS